ncbi:MAG: ChaN family lipoprotein [Oculatellaceae cyanobacterium Prado106]|nr:ChaN family lipoprotein [Oculatellaceae cyanobacterium Prado106]
MRYFVKLCACSLGLLLLWVVPSQAQSVSNVGLGRSPINLTKGLAENPLNSVRQISRASSWRSPSGVVEAATVLDDLARSRVVYLGETHDSAADHQAQLQILQALHERNPRLAIAMEMFQRPYQVAIDRYLAGEIDEATLQQQTEYDQRWGFPWEYYAPILRFAKANGLPVIALNVPAEITRQVARNGLESLSEGDRQWIPPAAEIQPGDPAYRQMLQEVYDQIHQGRSASSNFENFFMAQVLWDETMAEGVANFAKANPETQIVVLAGEGHIVFGHGIPSRVARRFQVSGVEGIQQRSVILNPEPEMVGEGAIADYFWMEE